MSQIKRTKRFSSSSIPLTFPYHPGTRNISILHHRKTEIFLCPMPNAPRIQNRRRFPGTSGTQLAAAHHRRLPYALNLPPTLVQRARHFLDPSHNPHQNPYRVRDSAEEKKDTVLEQRY